MRGQNGKASHRSRAHRTRGSEPGTIAEILALREVGKTQTEIATTLGVSQAHVCKVLARVGGAR